MQIHTTTTRQAYLDWLRILAIFGVLVFHSAMPFGAELEWHIRNKETSNLFLEMILWMHLFRMPLLFFISGTVSYFMLQHRTGGGFIGLRVRRLLIPVILGILVIVPPQIYLERVTQGFKGNFWQFYSQMFTTGAYPKGNLSWHHLWFVAYLLIYDILFAPLFVWIVSDKGAAFRNALQWLEKGKRVYLLTVPGIMLYAALARQFHETNDLVHDYCYFFYWLSFLLPGFLCMAQPTLMNSLERNRRTSFLVALASIVAINYFRWNNVEPWNVLTNWKQDPRTYMYIALSAICAWGWVLTAIGYGKKYLDKPHRSLNYLNQAVYPFYILHQTIIVILAYYVVQTSDTIGTKYLFIVITTFILSMGIFHLLIKPYPVCRFLFGMKPLAKKEKKQQQEQRATTEEGILLPVS
ncbi:acyltransferase family protein [Chitinophaga filiformis]|uniref:Peptidoglycan/LPS O-acetylase OafA/YrhL, contains acyltransferase and SGNH-hydrolase domains n=1 Tax=Chitinophaga filiformis TaxID=104663 RepID=A0A1G7YU39_CHIFI|nr:acyltransferase family protein [Chitinophaga filiformis]SDH00028.1 Peptidoglycan/LPS O-acetylase OafA/YrhL, contains acyltransferase and SGNH-hydrolase domains [Chitinophaga filiformis]